MKRTYWEECIAIALEEEGIKATEKQISNIAGSIEVSHENYGMSCGYECIPNPLAEENNKLKEELKKEQNKKHCFECDGRGYVTDSWGSSGRSTTSQCYKCHGEGKILK